MASTPSPRMIERSVYSWMLMSPGGTGRPLRLGGRSGHGSGPAETGEADTHTCRHGSPQEAAPIDALLFQ